MLNLTIFESLWDKEIFGGYSLSSFDWWVDLIVLGIAIVLIGGLYFVLVWLLGKMRFSEEDKVAYSNYKLASREEKKEQAKAAKGPVKNVITWHRMKPWFIPVVSFVLVIALLATPVLHTTWDILMTTLSGSAVTIYNTPSSMEAAGDAEENVVTIEEEGIVLLKNTHESLPLDVKDSEQKKINIFGSCAFGLFYGNGGSGSFQTDGRVKEFPRTAVKLEVAMEEEGFEINENIFNMIKNYYSSNRRTISVAPSDYDIQCGFNKYSYPEIVPSKAPYDYEPGVDAYNTPFAELGGKTLLEDAKEFSDTALFCITRRGSEDEDMRLSDLQLKANEIAVIDMLEEEFENVIILLNVPTVIEAAFLEDSEIDSAIYMGHPGLTGTRAVARVLNGKVNPSGHLVDTWPYDVTSAQSYQNFGNDTTLTHTGASTAAFTNYLENIYVGYRYYVTRAMVEEDFDYDEYVQYSFGYGLSYTQFDKSIVDFKVDKEKQTVTIGVEVKNVGEAAGKDVIEIYTHAPYDKNSGIEKSWFSLSAFLKTDVIEPGASAAYELEFTFREIASWSTKKGYYILEKGDYEFSLREDVWHLATTSTGRSNTKEMTLDADVEFKTSYQTGKQYENIFQDVEHGAGYEPIEYLSRADFKGTFKTKNEIDRTAVLENSDGENNFPGGTSNQTGGQTFSFADNQIEEDYPTMNEDNGLVLADLKDAEWEDPNWDKLLDQMSLTDLQNIVDQGSFKTAKIDSIGKAEATDYDGPGAAFHSGTGHPSEVIVACSWNADIGKIMGESIGKEGASRGLTGWYAPGINTHRSPFGGRNFEYYSEDPLIAGIMAGSTAQGALKYGVYTYAKHFICNEQEARRAGVMVWCSEQAMREIYARGFEIYCDMGGLGIMSSFNCIGSWWTGGSEALLTTLLREEWGFHGVVVTDYVSSPYMAVNIGIRAGNDLWLNRNPSCHAAHATNQTPHDAAILLRRSAKNVLYACAHSNNVWTEADYEAVGLIKPN